MSVSNYLGQKIRNSIESSSSSSVISHKGSYAFSLASASQVCPVVFERNKCKHFPNLILLNNREFDRAT
jgi:hypothetical protein